MTSFTTGPIGLPFSEETCERVKRAISGVFRGVYTEAPRTTASRPVTTTRPAMSYDSESTAITKIKAAVREGKILPGFARSAQDLVRQGKLSASQVDEFLDGMSRRPSGTVAGRYEDDE